MLVIGRPLLNVGTVTLHMSKLMEDLTRLKEWKPTQLFMSGMLLLGIGQVFVVNGETWRHGFLILCFKDSI